MKKFVTILVFVLAVSFSCLSYVTSASTDSLNDIESSLQNSTENLVGTEKLIETSPIILDDDIIEHVYEANGFKEDDKRTEVKLNITTGVNRANALGDANSSINNEATKSYIYDRMLNSIDYFDSLQATYYHIPSTGYSYYSTYCIQQGENPKSKEMIYNENGELISNCSFDGTFTANINGSADNVIVDANQKMKKAKSVKSIQNDSIEEKIESDRVDISVEEIISNNENTLCNKLHVDIESSKKLDFVSLVDSKKRIKYLPEENEDCYYYRNNLPQLPMSNTQYFSQAFAFGFLSDFEKWDVDRIDYILDRECFVVLGEIEGDYSKKIKTNKFEMWIDKEIGALLSLEGYDQNGSLSILLTTSEFIVDEPIAHDVFDDLSKL